MASHAVIYGLHNRDDTMTFKDEVDAAGERYWKSAYEDRVTDVLDACVEKIDELERDLDNVRAATAHTDDRLNRLEKRLNSFSFDLRDREHPKDKIED